MTTTVTKKEVLNQASSFISIKFGYSEHFVFPYKVGIEVIRQLEFAEKIDNSNYEDIKIVPIVRSEGPEISIMDEKEYIELKTKTLLGL